MYQGSQTEVNSKPAFPDRSIDQTFVMGMALIFLVAVRQVLGVIEKKEEADNTGR